MTTRETTTMNRWNLGVILAIVLQIVAFGYWGGQLQTEVDSLKAELVSKSDENLRQWARINKNEDSVQLALSNQRTTTALLERLERVVRDLQSELRATNTLLRENGERDRK